MSPEVFVTYLPGRSHAFKSSHRVNLYRAWVTLGLDGIAFRGQFRAVPADNLTLPSGTRFLAYAISQAKRGAQWERKRPSSWNADFSTTWIQTNLSDYGHPILGRHHRPLCAERYACQPQATNHDRDSPI